jgi:hypothetical protein
MHAGNFLQCEKNLFGSQRRRSLDLMEGRADTIVMSSQKLELWRGSTILSERAKLKCTNEDGIAFIGNERTRYLEIEILESLQVTSLN